MHIFCLNLGRHDSEYCCEEFRRNLSLPSHVRYIFLKCVVQLFDVKSFHSGNNFSRDSLFRSRRIARENMCETQKNVSLFFNTQLLIWREQVQLSKNIHCKELDFYETESRELFLPKLVRVDISLLWEWHSEKLNSTLTAWEEKNWKKKAMHPTETEQLLMKCCKSYTFWKHWRAPKINLYFGGRISLQHKSTQKRHMEWQ